MPSPVSNFNLSYSHTSNLFTTQLTVYSKILYYAAKSQNWNQLKTTQNTASRPQEKAQNSNRNLELVTTSQTAMLVCLFLGSPKCCSPTDSTSTEHPIISSNIKGLFYFEMLHRNLNGDPINSSSWTSQHQCQWNCRTKPSTGLLRFMRYHRKSCGPYVIHD